jgi:predicted HAD superfamily Cof-like phosphohydrolase
MTVTYPTDYELPLQRDVALFHDSFNMPNLLATPGPLPVDRIELRIGLLREEGIHELTEAIIQNDPVDIIDALIDTVYVALGALVEMGQDAGAFLHTDDRPFFDTFNAEALLAEAKLALKGNELSVQMLERAFSQSDAENATIILRTIVLGALRPFGRADLDPRPFFDEVQRANMSKLGADGKPVHSRGLDLDGYPAGKVLKGANYSAPDLAGVFAREIAAKKDRLLNMSEFERGVRAGVESMRAYFQDENEGPLHTEIPTSLLEQFERGAVHDVLHDEARRTKNAAH